jgi:hypothetical protein
MYVCMHVAVHPYRYSHVTIKFPELHASRDTDKVVASPYVLLLGIKRHCADREA